MNLAKYMNKRIAVNVSIGNVGERYIGNVIDVSSPMLSIKDERDNNIYDINMKHIAIIEILKPI